MNANIQFNTCDPERLESFLSGELTAGEEHDVTAHLSTCEICRRALEERAAEPALWSEAQELLRPSSFDPEATRPAVRHPLEIQHVLGSLKPTDDPEMLGRIGGYEVSGVVGSGGMGVVLKAVDRSLDRTVAIKVLSPHLATSGAARKRFSREAKAAAAVLHPNVIAIHSVSNDEDLPYLIMPYVRGASLQKRIDREGPLSLQEILRIGSQIAAGLAAAHAQGLVHRDIKPANILLEDGVERVTITDFGLARAVDDATITHSGVIAGTPQYMSPEQARGEAVGQQSDLFSLGSVLYATCTGRPPFRAETSYGIMRRITDDEPTPIREINPDIPEWLCTIVSRLMSKRAVDRFATADEVQELLETCLAHVQQPSAVPLPKLLTPKSSSGRGFFGSRKRFIAASGAIGALVLGMLFWQATSPPDISGSWTGTEWGTVELQQTDPGKYTGSYNDTFGKERGSLEMKWSRIERRFNGTWSEGKERFGKISVRLVDDEIRGAWTTSKESEIKSGIPRLADLAWVRNRVSSSIPTPNGEVPQLHPQQDEHSIADRNVPTTTAEKALARLVLVFFRDRARRAIPAVLIEAGDQTLVVAASPAGVTPDGFEPAVDRAFLEISATSQVEVTFLRESTKELNIYLVDRKLDGAYRPDPSLKLNDGDRLSVASFENSRQFHLEPDHVRIVSRAATAQLNLADRGIRHTYDNLIEIDRTLQEGTPLFKDGKLAGLTLLGTRFLGEKSGKSYAVPVSRIVEFCEETLPNILQSNVDDREKSHAVEPPSQIEVIRALAEQEGLEQETLTNLYSKHRDNFRIVVEQVYDKVDPPRLIPTVGMARLHRVRFKCTVYFTETTEAKWPVDTKTEKEISRVVNIDVDHLDVVDADVAQPESPVERLTAKQVVERGQELYYSRKKVTVRFKVAGVVTIKVTDENGETSEWWKLMAEGTEDFSAKISPELQSIYQAAGIVDLNEHFKGKEVEVQGTISAVGLRLISRPDTIWTYHIDVTSHDQIRETREETNSSIHYRGRCLQNEDGKPIDGAVVQFFAYRYSLKGLKLWKTTKTDAQGNFEIAGKVEDRDDFDPMRSRITISAEGRASEVFFYQIIGEPTLFRMEPASMISGVVTYQGQPVAGATLNVGGKHLPGVNDAISNADGKFVISDLRASNIIGVITARHPEFESTSKPFLEIPTRVEIAFREKRAQASEASVRQFEASGEVRSIACTPDGELLAILNAGDTSAPPGMSKQTVDLVEAKTGTAIRRFELQTKADGEILASSDWLPETTSWPMVISPDAKFLAVTAGFGRVKVFSLETGELIHSLDDEPGKLAEKTTPESLQLLKRTMGSVQHLAFSPDGSLLVTSGESFEDVARNWGGVNRLGHLMTGPGRLKVWDVKTGALKYDLVGHSHAGPVAFSSDGMRLASGGRWDSGDDHGIGVHIWDVATGEKVRTIGIDSNGFVLDVEFSPQRSLILISSVEFDKENDTRSQSISVLYAQSGVVEWKRSIDGVPHQVAFSGEGSNVLRFLPNVEIEVYGRDDGNRIQTIGLPKLEDVKVSRWGAFDFSARGNRVFSVGIRSGEPPVLVVWEFDSSLSDAATFLELQEAIQWESRANMSRKYPEKRLQNLQAAAKAYERVSREYRSQFVGLSARVAQARCLQQLGETEQAKAIFNELLELPGTDERTETLKQAVREYLIKLRPEE